MNVEVPRARAIFLDAVERCEPHEWPQFLDAACEGDPSLRRRVEVLLQAHARSAGLLDDLAEGPGPTMDLPGPEESVGSSIGPYKLLEAIGEGGMGIVYMAEQTQPVRRKVALKIIRPGMDTKPIIARFEAERQALALMDHPNIARVLDAGATESGRPYFVMELVRGIPITEYCDREQLSIPERLDLFVLVCRAVQHAHQKGIIHRDLKPSNVLVTVIDGVAVPKVIDFGVAKATGTSLTERTLCTGFHQFVGTPLYMSPEQADVSGVDVDTRSDIYSLGVLLYELLTGTTPFDSETLKKAAFDEMRRIIREHEPPKPSARLSTLGESLSTVSARRKAEPRQLNREMRGELDWIVMKALEKDRRRRYETSNDFAADVMRYLTDQPVEACPPSARYRFSKYARRNRAVLTTVVLVGVALVAGTGVSVRQAARAKAAEADAQRRAEESKQVIDYLARDIFGGIGAGDKNGRPLTASELLAHADATVGARFRRQPMVEASVRLALSQSYRVLWDQQRAGPHAARAVELRTRYLGPEHPETLAALSEQALVLRDEGWKDRRKWESAAAILRRVIAGRRRALGPANPEALVSQSDLSFLLIRLGRLDEALAEAEQAEAIALRTLGPDHQTTLDVWYDLGQVVGARGDPQRGMALLRRVVAGREQFLGPLDPTTTDAMGHLADLAREDGQLQEAQRLYLDVIDRSGRVYGLSHSICWSSIRNLIEILRQQGDYAAIRDTCQGWIRELLAEPREADPHLRYRRSVCLGKLALNVATLPEPIQFDADLAVRAAKEAAAVDGGWYGWMMLGAIHCRMGRLDDALQAFQAATQQPNWAGGNDLYWFALAVAHARRGDLARARQCYERGRAPATGRDTWTDIVDAFRAEAADRLGVKPDPSAAILKTAPESKQSPE
jgi:serine/threonine protein kinase/tetratricopeptide (TPR) repeat protein